MAKRKKSDLRKINQFDTLSVHAGIKSDPLTGAVMTPIYATSTFAQDTPGKDKGYEYSRSQNPTREVLEASLAELENGHKAFAFASGVAAQTAVIDLLKPGDHVIAFDDLYGGTFRLFNEIKAKSSNIDFTFVDLNTNFSKHIQKNTKMIWVETPTNPLLKIADLKRIARIAKKHKLLTVCDNTFATPINQRPLDFGIDIVVHSATKYLNGHSDVVGGVTVCAKHREDLADQLFYLSNSVGGILSPFDSFLLLRSLKTLAVRMEKHCDSASRLAQYLDNHPSIEKVIYPGLVSHPQYDIAKRQMDRFGGMITAILKGGLPASQTFLENTKVFSLAESLGGVESLIEHPAIMTHASVPKEVRDEIGIVDGLVRFSVGIETYEDLQLDLEQALSCISQK